MQLEHVIKVFPIDESLKEEVEKLTKEGWQMVQGVKPVAIYHLVRNHEQVLGNIAGGLGVMTIDEDKVFISPAKKDQN